MAESTPAGWYPDPDVPFQQRYWDGNAWTDHVASSDEVAPEIPSAPAGPSAAAGWYHDPNVDGQQRYWDGSAWTDHTAPASVPPPPTAAGAAPSDPVEQDSDQTADNAKKGGIGCLILIAIVGVFWIIGSVSGDDDSGGGGGGADTGDEIGAQVVCEDFVEDRLKSPGSAEFSDEEVTGSHPEFTVTGSVDSENSFGALIRNTYTCTVKYTGDDNWQLVEITGLEN